MAGGADTGGCYSEDQLEPRMAKHDETHLSGRARLGRSREGQRVKPSGLCMGYRERLFSSDREDEGSGGGLREEASI